MSLSPAKPRTLAEKVWDDHVVMRGEVDESGQRNPDLIYIDLHLVHEVTSPQAFDGLRVAGRPVRRTDLTIATEDHNAVGKIDSFVNIMRRHRRPQHADPGLGPGDPRSDLAHPGRDAAAQL